MISSNKPLKIVKGHANQNCEWPKSAKIITLVLSVLLVVIGLIAAAAIFLAITYATSLELITSDELSNTTKSTTNTSKFPFQTQDQYYLNDSYQFSGK